MRRVLYLVAIMVAGLVLTRGSPSVSIDPSPHAAAAHQANASAEKGVLNASHRTGGWTGFVIPTIYRVNDFGIPNTTGSNNRQLLCRCGTKTGLLRVSWPTTNHAAYKEGLVTNTGGPVTSDGHQGNVSAMRAVENRTGTGGSSKKPIDVATANDLKIMAIGRQWVHLDVGHAPQFPLRPGSA